VTTPELGTETFHADRSQLFDVAALPADAQPLERLMCSLAAFI
jgi:hypothetical protein